MATKTQQKKLSLKPIEKALKEVLKGLETVAKQRDLDAKQKKILARDIKNVKKLIKEIPPNCLLHTPPYDFRYWADGPDSQLKSRILEKRAKRRTGEVRYHRSPYLMSYWLGPVLVFENYARQKRIAGSVFASEVLDYCGEGKTLRQIEDEFPEQRRAVRTGIRQLLKHSLLEICGQENRELERSWAGWSRWNPAAGYFHLSTKDPKFAVVSEDRISGLRRLAKVRPLPPRVKEYAGVPLVALPKCAGESEFAQVLEERRTWREFAAQAVPLEKLAWLLWLSFGVQSWAKIPGVGNLALKTSPSGGAMHPLEAYVMIRKVEGVAAGIYHYGAAEHRLELLRKGVRGGEIAKMLGGQRWAGDAAFVVLLTAVFGRTQWKYEHARAYRVVLAEAGHQCQTFCLTATWLGLAPFCTMALADTQIEKMLGIDGVSESVLYAAGAGVRPAGMATADRWRAEAESSNRFSGIKPKTHAQAPRVGHAATGRPRFKKRSWGSRLEVDSKPAAFWIPKGAAPVRNKAQRSKRDFIAEGAMEKLDSLRSEWRVLIGWILRTSAQPFAKLG
jgi:SagB-type dehydrogenase family enzyme